MAIRVGINGFGRIGRTVFRIISQNPDRFELCGINLRNLNMEYMAYTALYDSVHGHFPGTIEAGSQHLIVNGKPVRIFSESDPANIEWASCGAEYIIESTGAFNTTAASSAHMKGGAKKIIITAPAKDEVTVDFDEAALGCEKVIRLSGSDGKIQSFKVRIPAGMDDGEQLRLKGKGHTGADGTTGDLFLKIKIRPKNGCERKGLDVYTTVTIPYVTAALGGKARIHTLYGDVDCNIKGGTQDGSKIRLRGKGIVSRKNPSIHGDQYVKVQIQVPKYLSPEAKKKLQEYSMMC